MTIDKHEDYLLLRMLPEQVSEGWDFYAPVIAKSLPPTVTNARLRMVNVLHSILKDELVVWVYQSRAGDIKYVMSTLERIEPVSLTKDLLLYSFTGLGDVKPVDLLTGFEKLSMYGKSRGCVAIIAYVDEPRVVRFLVNQGARADFKLVQMEIK